MRLNFFFGEAFGSLKRNWVMTMAAVLTVFTSMAILGSVLVSDKNLNQGTTALKNRVEIRMFLKDSVLGTPAQKALETMIAQDPQVKRFEFVSKDQALQWVKNNMGTDVVQYLNTNPLPASYNVYVKNPGQIEQVAAEYYGNPAIDETGATSEKPHPGVTFAKETVRKMLGTISLIEKGMWGITGVFALAALMLISTTVRLSIFARRREIEIMRLVGATNWFIRWPFVLEGFVTGLTGSLLATIGIWVLNLAIVNWIKTSGIGYLHPVSYPIIWGGGRPGLLLILGGLGAVLGSVGGGFALRRYLKV
jgi:cell division transport system permease protein